jgi:ribosomal protein L11 methyltransferase
LKSQRRDFILKWTEIKITTNEEAYDAITGILYDIGAVSLQIEDPRVSQELGKNNWGEILDEKLYYVKTDDIVFKTYFPEGSNILQILELLKNQMKKAQNFLSRDIGTIETKEVFEEDWANNWKKYFKPFKIGKKIVIKPSWEKYKKQNKDEIIIEIDPQTAFGTGTHDTTRMCIELIEKYIRENSEVLDLGCGSGILGICSSKLDAKSCLCVDIDSQAVKIANENAELNKTENVEVIQGDLMSVVRGKYDIIVANIITDIIIKLTPLIGKHLSNDGVFISSGIIKSRYPEIKETLLKNGFSILDEMTSKEWAAVAVKL